MIYTKGSSALQTGADSNTTISELFHLAGQKRSYSDEELAKAVHKSSYAADADSVLSPEANIFDKRYQPRGLTEQQSYSFYFHYIQFLHCDAIPQPAGHPRRVL